MIGLIVVVYVIGTKKIYGGGQDHRQTDRHTDTSLLWIDPALGPGWFKDLKIQRF